MKVLVLGGAGYIGSHMCKLLEQKGHQSVVFDDLSTGYREAVKWSRFFEGSLLDKRAVESVFAQFGPFDLVMHFCAKSLVGESVNDPVTYYQNNVSGTLNLLEVMVKTEHRRLVFSSTAAVYGTPCKDLIDETHQRKPINPYGQSKKIVEDILKDMHAAHGLRSVSLRYFNACGADEAAEIGERHEPETHLIPNVLKSLLAQGDTKLKVFGNQYDTDDGTCVRDYIHINDLAEAHLLAGDYLSSNDGAYAFNLGNGYGFSVLEVIQAVERVVGNQVSYTVESPRAGDPPSLVANAELAKKELGWQAKYQQLDAIIQTAWRWHQSEKF